MMVDASGVLDGSAVPRVWTAADRAGLGSLADWRDSVGVQGGPDVVPRVGQLRTRSLHADTGELAVPGCWRGVARRDGQPAVETEPQAGPAVLEGEREAALEVQQAHGDVALPQSKGSAARGIDRAVHADHLRAWR